MKKVDEDKCLKEWLANKDKGLTFEIRFPKATYYLFDLYVFIGYFDKDGIGHVSDNYSHCKSYEEILEDWGNKVKAPYRKTLSRLIKNGLLEEMHEENKLVCEIKPLEEECT